MNYEKLYKEALKRARKIYNAAMDAGYIGDCKTFEVLFPELKESEDERIRKEFVEYTRTDAFIEKAWGWIENNILSSNQQDKSRLYFEQFKNYIEGGEE